MQREQLQVAFHRIHPDETRPLRKKLLRRGAPLNKLVYPGDYDSSALHVGAFLNGQQIGIATVVCQPPSASTGTPTNHPAPDTRRAWRIRGMAVEAFARRQGVGEAMLRACIGHAARARGEFIWCDARLNAVAFYEKYGFETMGNSYIVPNVGPHYFMQRPLTPDDTALLSATLDT